MKPSARIALLCLGLTVAAAAHGAEDVAGAKDHPLLTRYPDSRITEYSSNYDLVEYKIGAKGEEPTAEPVEGETTALRYFYNNADTQPSPLQLIRNYQNAVKAIGGEVVYERLPADGDGGETTLKLTTDGKTFWIKVLPDIWGVPTHNYQLVITEIAAMQQVVSANELLDELNKNGFITLYINFDTGKADLKADGLATAKELATMMGANPSLRLAVEGHTDNVGDAASNQKLSEARARSVMTAIVDAGIDGSRLSAAGFGAERPIADNRSEDGRAKNRRVELVKQP